MGISWPPAPPAASVVPGPSHLYREAGKNAVPVSGPERERRPAGAAYDAPWASPRCVEAAAEQAAAGGWAIPPPIGPGTPHIVSIRGKTDSSSTIPRPAATGMAMSAPITPSSAPPITTATTVTMGCTLTAYVMALGMIR